MHILEHLFLVGEFPERAHLLSGLTLEQVTLRPDGASHSIYEELWHLVGYQQSIIAPGAPVAAMYPIEPPDHEELGSVAVHNAYHFGKIVALRQRIGAWPPEVTPPAETLR